MTVEATTAASIVESRTILPNSVYDVAQWHVAPPAVRCPRGGGSLLDELGIWLALSDMYSTASAKVLRVTLDVSPLPDGGILYSRPNNDKLERLKAAREAASPKAARTRAALDALSAMARNPVAIDDETLAWLAEDADIEDF